MASQLREDLLVMAAMTALRIAASAAEAALAPSGGGGGGDGPAAQAEAELDARLAQVRVIPVVP